MVIDADLGVAFGLVVRSMGFAKSFGASFSALRQGEVSQYTQLLEDSRRHAILSEPASTQVTRWPQNRRGKLRLQLLRPFGN